MEIYFIGDSKYVQTVNVYISGTEGVYLVNNFIIKTPK